VLLHVRQTQQLSEWVPVFQTSVEIGIATPSGKQTYKVWIRHQEEHFEFPSPEKPLLVKFDEGNHLLKELTFPKTTEELTYQLRKDDALGRMWAASQLSQHLSDSAAGHELEASATDDPFWAVRKAAIEALAPSFKPADIPYLEKRALDPKSAVRVAALHALGGLKERALSPYFQDRYRVEESYLAQAEALRSIGKCGDTSAIPFLHEASLTKSPRNLIQSAAQQAIDGLK
jgi:aminopeptidase N